MAEDEHLKDVISQERRRGRKPTDFEERRKKLKRSQEMRKLLLLGTEEGFREAMHAFGIREGSKEFSDALGAGRELRP